MTSVSYTVLELHLPLRDPVSRLQDTTAQIRDIADYVCNIAASLAREEASMNELTYKTLHELGLVLDGDNAWTAPSDRPSSEEVHGPTQTRKPTDI